MRVQDTDLYFEDHFEIVFLIVDFHFNFGSLVYHFVAFVPCNHGLWIGSAFASEQYERAFVIRYDSRFLDKGWSESGTIFATFFFTNTYIVLVFFFLGSRGK